MIGKVSPGQPFRPRADIWNQFAAAANAYSASSGPGMSAGSALWLQNSGAVWVKNTTGGSLKPYTAVSLLGLAGNVPTGTEWGQDDISLTAFSIQDVADDLPVAILQKGLDTDEIGRASVDGVIPGYVNVVDESHTFAEPEPGSGVLTATLNGPARILWKQAGTGTKLAVLCLSGGEGFQLTPVRITGPKDTYGLHPGEVYGNGTWDTPTDTLQYIWLHGFEVKVDPAIEQGFFMAMRTIRDISGVPNVVYEVLPQMPMPPRVGVCALMSIGGLVYWSPVVDCEGSEASS